MKQVFAVLTVCLLSTGAFALEPTRASLNETAQSLSAFTKGYTSLEQITVAVSANGFDYIPELVAAEKQIQESGFELIPTSQWMKSRGHQLLAQPSMIRSASIEDVRKLLGGLTREERFNSGLVAKAVLTGVYTAAQERVLEASH